MTTTMEDDDDDDDDVDGVADVVYQSVTQPTAARRVRTLPSCQLPPLLRILFSIVVFVIWQNSLNSFALYG